VSEERIRSLLQEAPLPDEEAARERSWRVVRAAFEGRIPAPRQSPRARRLGLALAGAAGLLAIALSPAGARVGDVIRDVTGIGEHHAASALTSLPAQGRLLVDSPAGPWVVQDDGTKRLLGDYSDSTWSPGGLYVGVAKDRELAAVDPEGNVRWTLDRSTAVHNPRWSESGFRVAYRTGSSLRTVAGDGTGDHLVAGDISPVPVAWKPLSRAESANASQGISVPELAAYARRNGTIAVVNVDSGAVQWVARPPSPAVDISWSTDGRLLLAVGRNGLATYAPARSTDPIAEGYGSATSIASALFIPGTHRLAEAVQLQTGPGQVVSEIRYGRADAKLFLSDELASRQDPFTGLIASPDGRWLLATQPDPDRWLFIRVSDGRVKSVSDIASQFAPGATGPVASPRVEGWCCGP
jgi:hypothetical protein